VQSSILRTCSHSGCTTLTLGELCISHEAPVTQDFPRGRPFVPPELVEAPSAGRPGFESEETAGGELVSPAASS
jgi:hypothetical protein